MNPVPIEQSCSAIHKETNARLWERNVPSEPLQPNFSVRPVLTKYSVLPIVDPRPRCDKSPVGYFPTFNAERDFNPGNDRGPWSGFSSQINTESELRNQVFALQRCSQAVYVPPSSSDLYYIHKWNKTIPHEMSAPFSLLGEKETWSSYDPNPDKVAETRTFLNSTRHEYRDMDVFCEGGSKK